MAPRRLAVADEEHAPRALPDPKVRLAIAVVIGCVAGVLCHRFLLQDRNAGGDFTPIWRAAWAIVNGEDPYRVIVFGGGRAWGTAMLYPLPSAFVALPLIRLQPIQAATVFFGASSFLAAFLVTRQGYHRLWLFLSPCFLVALLNAQWAPFMLAATFLPSILAGLVVLKPTVGLACFAYRPRWSTVIGGAMLIAAAFVVQPHWVVGWLKWVRWSPYAHTILLQTILGPLCLVAALRWRTPEGRLLLAMSVVPHSLFWYDETLLWLVPGNAKQGAALTLSAWVGFFIWHWLAYRPGVVGVSSTVDAWLMTVFIYLPAVAMLLLARDREPAASPEARTSSDAQPALRSGAP